MGAERKRSPPPLHSTSMWWTNLRRLTAPLLCKVFDNFSPRVWIKLSTGQNLRTELIVTSEVEPVTAERLLPTSHNNNSNNNNHLHPRHTDSQLRSPTCWGPAAKSASSRIYRVSKWTVLLSFPFFFLTPPTLTFSWGELGAKTWRHLSPVQDLDVFPLFTSLMRLHDPISFKRRRGQARCREQAASVCPGQRGPVEPPAWLSLFFLFLFFFCHQSPQQWCLLYPAALNKCHLDIADVCSDSTSLMGQKRLTRKLPLLLFVNFPGRTCKRD